MTNQPDQQREAEGPDFGNLDSEIRIPDSGLPTPLRVLVIDDDAGDAELLRRYLEEIPGFEIDLIHFTNPTIALTELARREVDVTFLDYRLGAETGLDVLKTIRELGDLRPVISLTGRGDERVAAELTRAGVDDYLVKNDLTPDLLRRAIEHAKARYEHRKAQGELTQRAKQLEHLNTQLQDAKKTLEENVQTVEQANQKLSDANRQLVEEISERERAQKALRSSEARFRAIVDTAAEGIIITDERGVIESFNPAAAWIFGYTPEEAIGLNVSMLMPAPDSQQHSAHMARYLESGETTIIGTVREVDAQRQDGSLVPIELAISEVHVADSRVFTGIVHDLSERKRSEATLEKAKQAAEAANCAKSQFLANISHEIRTPMTAIIGMTEIVLDTDLTPQQQDSLKTVQRSADALLELINDILDLSKIEVGKLDLYSTDFNLKTCLNDTIQSLSHRADRKGLKLACHISLDVPDALIGDFGRLRQILINLVGNAIKFTETGEVVLAVEKESQTAEQICLHFRVTDTGIGIPPDKQKAIFDAFVQADGSTTRNYGGTGLGLSISSRLTKLMGGRIWVDSELGRGSTFHFTAQFEVQKEPHSPSEIDESHGNQTCQTAASENLHILLAEDNIINQKVFVRMLEKQGHTVLVVENGKEVLVALEQDSFDLILMDMQMPVLTGYETTRQLRASGYTGPIVALTAHAMSGDREKCLAAGCDDYLTKPLDGRRLTEILAEYSNRFRSTCNPNPKENSVEGETIIVTEGEASTARDSTPRQAERFLDVDAALQRLQGDRELLADQVELFLEFSPGLLTDVERAVAAGDSAAVHIAAHSIKGVLADFTAKSPLQTAAMLEQRSADGDLTESHRLLEKLQQEVTLIADELREFIQRDSETESEINTELTDQPSPESRDEGPELQQTPVENAQSSQTFNI